MAFDLLVIMKFHATCIVKKYCKHTFSFDRFFANTIAQNSGDGTYCKNAIFSLFIGDLLCYKLTFTSDDSTSVTGTYIISNEKASKSPDKPVYKLEDQDRFIYFTPSFGHGWRIGAKNNLAGEEEGRYYYRSKNFIPFLSKCAYMIDDILILFFY